MNSAKIQLSEDELALVRNADWILTKNAIISKQYQMYGELSEKMKKGLAGLVLPDRIFATNAKISRGEGLAGLPYVILDYPRVYSKTDVFAMRILFWWAHYFSFTLHLKGEYQQKFLNSVIANREKLAAGGFRVHITQNEWEYREGDTQVTALTDIDESGLRAMLVSHPFLKLTAKIDLIQWNQAEYLLLKAFHCACGIFA